MPRPSPEVRLWSRINKNSPNGCWNWLGPKSYQGYGWCKVGKERMAHRGAWILTYGEIPKGKWVLHHCDNPSCVNPEHLFLGNALDNMLDKARKNRCNSVRGESHPASVLKTRDVFKIRKLFHSGQMTRRKISERFRVSYAHISSIISGKYWKHV